MNLVTKPSLNQLQEVKLWLTDEYETTQQGFYCDWTTIEKSFNSNSFFVFKIEDRIIGFLSWTDYHSYVNIDIMEIHPRFRREHLGKEFYKKVEEYFHSHNYKAIMLFCAPEESEHFWTKMEFRKFPDRGYSDPELTYYKPLIELNEPVLKDCENKLELWNLEPYQIRGERANWIWNIENNTKPILQPCNSNWNLKLTLKGEKVKEDRVKYFSGKKEILLGPFLYIETFE